MALSEQNSHRSIFSQPAQHSPLDAHRYRSPPRAAAEVLLLPPHQCCSVRMQQRGGGAVQQQPAAAAATTAAKPYMASLTKHTARDTWPARVREQHAHTTLLLTLQPPEQPPSSSLSYSHSNLQSRSQPCTCQVMTCQPPSAAPRTAQQEQQQPKKTESSQPLAGPPTLPRKQRRRASQPHTTRHLPVHKTRAAPLPLQPALLSSYPPNSKPIKEEPISQPT
jgi:hypothetical protein